MPRIRSIKPEMFSDEKLATLPVITRFVFVGLISMADDAGRLLDNAKIIDAFLFPETSETSRRSLDELSSIGRIRRGTTAAGQRIIEITNWARHQRIDRANLSRSLPEIVTEADATAPLTGVRRSFDESSTNPRRVTHESLDEPSSIDREGEGEKEREKEQQPRAGARETAAAARDHARIGNAEGEAPGAVTVALTVAANQAIALRYGEQPSPILASNGSSHELAVAMAASGIPVAFGADVIAGVVARSSFRRPPRSLGYFRAAIFEAWEARQAHEQARSSLHPERLGAPAASGGPVEYTPAILEQRAHFFAWLAVTGRGWAYLSTERREAELPYLRHHGYLPDEEQFRREWQVIRPLVAEDRLEALASRTPPQIVEHFRAALADAVAAGALVAERVLQETA